MRKLLETYRLVIKPLTPIHIGSGEEINPGEYFIFNEGNGPVLYAIDIGYMASKLLKGRDAILKWLTQDPIGWVAKAANNNTFAGLVKKYSRFQCEVTQRVAGEISSRWGKGASRLGIRTLQRPFRDPIIPGSSIKGAIRTALLYGMVKKPLDRTPDRGFEVAKWERRQMGGTSENISDDPLRHLSIGDAAAPGLKTVVYDADFYGMRTQAGDQAELQAYYECFPETLDGADEYCLETTLTIASGHRAYSENAREITARRILNSCRAFSEAVIQADLSYWKREEDKEMVVLYQNLQDRLAQEKNVSLIRLGWGSGMDAVGLNLAKPTSNQRIRTADARFRRSAATRRLLDSLPPGWAEIKLQKV